MEAWITLVFVVLSLGVTAFGAVAGMLLERRHLAQLARDEAELAAIMVTSMKRLPRNWTPTSSTLVVGSTVMSTDAFRRWVANLINLVGGRIGVYESMLERARREAMVRLLREAQAAGANVVWNVRLETAAIGGGEKDERAKGIEVIASGTAMRVG
ncbi:MAG: heavy metal-binding domain-containing protein [Pirellulales bacterium]